ncbi:MAG: c-type cytochrome [Bacteroidales bacterium]|nr:c-type cytochrome [Bacteroidales bacterium]
MKQEDRYRLFFSQAAKFSALMIIFILVVGWVSEGLFSSWKQLQREYSRTIRKKYPDPQERANLLPEHGVYQVELEELKRTDRCITCHLAIEGSLLDSLDQPFKVHPGSHLEHHPVKQYGCTICHGGQGQALDKRNAFALNPQNDWDHPILESPFIESSCGKCHLSLFSVDSILANSAVLEHGRTIFLREGCLGCHKARGVGGMLGPDLTAQGDKTKHEYNFRNIKGKQTISNWIEQHFMDPEMVSPGSRMLHFDLPKSELEALATCVMGLSKPDLPYEYIGLDVLNELKGIRPDLDGGPLYGMTCSACHGTTGEGKRYTVFKSGIPAIGQPGFMAIASPDYIAFILHYGRTSQLMTSWAPDFSGLSLAEVEQLNKLVRSRRAANSTWNVTSELVRTGKGSKQEGEALFRTRCQTCHGPEAKGDLAIGFNHPDFFRAASMEYLYLTIFRGRLNTAMPSWSFLTDQEIGDLISYIGSFGDLKISHEASGIRHQIFKMPDPRSPIPDMVSSAERFHYLCSRCHGEYGEGGTGPAILNHDFLLTADDRFLYQTISFGREHTPMHGWIRSGSQEGGLPPGEILGIVDFIKSCQDTNWEYIYPGPTLGDKTKGKELFGSLCSACHGTHGTGLKAPSLNDQVFLNAATNGFLAATITLGREGTEMPEWGSTTEQHPALTTQQRNDLVAFIRSWQRVHLPVSSGQP